MAKQCLSPNASASATCCGLIFANDGRSACLRDSCAVLPVIRASDQFAVRDSWNKKPFLQDFALTSEAVQDTEWYLQNPLTQSLVIPL
jgi:hypothetical protein